MFSAKELSLERHSKFLHRILFKVNPQEFSSLDSSRMTLTFFCVSGLDILNRLNDNSKDSCLLSVEDRSEVVRWIKSSLVESGTGFDGSPLILGSRPALMGRDPIMEEECGHIAMTYSALSSLLSLGDDLSGLDRRLLTKGVRELQLQSGTFSASLRDRQHDMRFLYCASAICFILDDWSGMDAEAAEAFILDSLSYDGGFAQNPGCESHGGSTFCAVASLYLMGRLSTALSPRQTMKLKRWCSFRLHCGFQGRPNKPSDVCYSFWVGATLKMLNVQLDFTECLHYALSAQDPVIGGFAKWPDHTPDPLHTYFGLGGLSLMNVDSLQSIHPALNVTSSAYQHLLRLHQQWRN